MFYELLEGAICCWLSSEVSQRLLSTVSFILSWSLRHVFEAFEVVLSAVVSLPVLSEHEKTPCERQRDAAQSTTTTSIFSLWFQPTAPYIPQCDAHGSFESTQCHSAIGQCWCADADGREIPNTRTGAANAPLCEFNHPGGRKWNCSRTGVDVVVPHRYQSGCDSASRWPDTAARR